MEFIPADEYQDLPEHQSTEELAVQDWESTMVALAQPNTRLRVPRNQDVSRAQVVGAFTNAFELIGGVPRLALWANENQKEFYKLYGRLLPSQASSALGETNELVIKHVLPRGALD